VATLFIADLHLQTEEPAITAGFLRFLTGTARQADALYILGDLFEAWIGDDDPTLHREIAAAIKALVDSGVPCYFIHGNRDFLLGNAMRAKAACSFCRKKVLDLYGRKVLIMHGDTLCTDDAGYQAFRAKVHKPWLQRLFRPAAVCSPTYRSQNAREAKPPTAANRWPLWTLIRRQWLPRWKDTRFSA
jgi:UDP-2,3-diacylglucosamine hydrolase